MPKVKSVSRGPSTVDPHSSPPPKPFVAPVAPLEVPSPPVSTAEGASQRVSTSPKASTVSPQHRAPLKA